MGLIAPAWTDSSFIGHTTTVTVCSLCSAVAPAVAQDLGSNQLRVLTPA